MLYRIIQEALNNILKHAQASTVRMYLTRNKRFLFLEIQDNGRGFVPEKVRKGLGLNNIRNRAELLGGKVHIKAAPGAGCILKVVIPFQRAAPSL
jgi:signal transduction histidine kinase